jgi:hypothetical protein
MSAAAGAAILATAGYLAWGDDGRDADTDRPKPIIVEPRERPPPTVPGFAPAPPPPPSLSEDDVDDDDGADDAGEDDRR